MAKPQGLTVASIPAAEGDASGALDHERDAELVGDELAGARPASSSPLWVATISPSASSSTVVGSTVPPSAVMTDASGSWAVG